MKKRTSWNKGLTKETDSRIKNYSDKITKTLKRKYKSGKIKIWNKNVKMKELYPHAGFQKGNKYGYISISLGYKRILKEAKRMEKQGFRIIPIGKVVPDIIAIKNNKVYAIEVEYGKRPDYSKYEKNDYTKYFDDIIWILRKKK